LRGILRQAKPKVRVATGQKKTSGRRDQQPTGNWEREEKKKVDRVHVRPRPALKAERLRTVKKRAQTNRQAKRGKKRKRTSLFEGLILSGGDPN